MTAFSQDSAVLSQDSLNVVMFVGSRVKARQAEGSERGSRTDEQVARQRHRATATDRHRALTGKYSFTYI